MKKAWNSSRFWGYGLILAGAGLLISAFIIQDYGLFPTGRGAILVLAGVGPAFGVRKAKPKESKLYRYCQSYPELRTSFDKTIDEAN